jgi:hypothetical protein
MGCLINQCHLSSIAAQKLSVASASSSGVCVGRKQNRSEARFLFISVQNSAVLNFPTAISNGNLASLGFVFGQHKSK